MFDLKLLQDKTELEKVEKLINEFKTLDSKQRYRKIFQANNNERNLISTAVWLLSLREKAENKFSQSALMFFNDLGLEQASSEKIAKHIAKRFKSNWQVVDLSCGIGANTLALAEKCHRVLANDNNEEILEIAKLNASALGLENKIDFSLLKAEELINFLLNKDFSLLPKKYLRVDAFFLDPARDREGKTKTRSILNSRPNLLEILPELFKITKNVAVKISPAFDYQELKMIEEKGEVEIISENNNCKVAMLWFGGFKKNRRSVACFRKKGNYFFSGQGLQLNDTELSYPEKYLYEPDKAISKAGLVDDLAKDFCLKKISADSPFLTGEKSPEEIARGLDKDSVFFALNIYQLIKVFNISFKELKKELKELGVEKVEIKARKHFLKPEEIYSKLRLKEGTDYVLLFTPLNNNPKSLVLMKKHELLLT